MRKEGDSVGRSSLKSIQLNHYWGSFSGSQELILKNYRRRIFVKRLVSYLLVMSLLLTLSISAFAKADIKKVDLTENQKNILRAYGLSDEEIENIDIETIRDTLKNGVVVNSEKFAEKPDWNKNKLTADVQAKLDKKNLSQSQINRLNNRGYTYEEIADMEIELNRRTVR